MCDRLFKSILLVPRKIDVITFHAVNLSGDCKCVLVNATTVKLPLISSIVACIDAFVHSSFSEMPTEILPSFIWYTFGTHLHTH